MLLNQIPLLVSDLFQEIWRHDRSVVRYGCRHHGILESSCRYVTLANCSVGQERQVVLKLRWGWEIRRRDTWNI